MADVNNLTHDHVDLSDAFAARRYFRKFEAITTHLGRVAATMEAEGSLSKIDVAILSDYVDRLAGTFRALSLKYLLTGRDTGQFFGSLAFDNHESGFPVHRELLIMANDAQQAHSHLMNMPPVAELKSRMVSEIVGQLRVPVRLQFSLSQRLYYEELIKGALFWASNDPEPLWLGNLSEDRRNPRRRFMVHWASYDSQTNLPTIYLMEVEDTGKTSLPKDTERWPEVQRHLMAQALGGLKLLTIAKGFDEDFDDLHPKRLRRFHVGPMYSSAYTRQSGPLQKILEDANAPQGQDWALAWTAEDLVSERVETEKKGWFGSVEREIFALDPFSGRGVDMGASLMSRAIILPERPFQALAEQNPRGFHDVRKFVVGAGGKVLSYA